ncbi:hypothetical protein B0H19DRAFT_1252071 [Mycena capillaripes]|nr:hypothetical protein B0H19DRAFT_1252071 [Mycena capillaripes]
MRAVTLTSAVRSMSAVFIRALGCLKDIKGGPCLDSDLSSKPAVPSTALLTMKITSSFVALIATIGISAVSATPLTNVPVNDGVESCKLRGVTIGLTCHKYAECFTFVKGKHAGDKGCCKHSNLKHCANYLTDPDCMGLTFIESYQFCKA